MMNFDEKNIVHDVDMNTQLSYKHLKFLTFNFVRLQATYVPCGLVSRVVQSVSRCQIHRSLSSLGVDVTSLPNSVLCISMTSSFVCKFYHKRICPWGLPQASPIYFSRPSSNLFTTFSPFLTSHHYFNQSVTGDNTYFFLPFRRLLSLLRLLSFPTPTLCLLLHIMNSTRK